MRRRHRALGLQRLGGDDRTGPPEPHESQTRYAAPSTFTTRNASRELWSSAPTPSIATAETTNSPAAFPSELGIARRAPPRTAFDSASSTAGPGLNVAASDAATNSANVA